MFLAILILASRLRKKSRELTAEKQHHFVTTEKAKHVERLNHEIYNNTNDYIFFHDLDGHFREVNAAAIRETGYLKEQWERLNMRDLVPEHLKNQCALYLDRIRKNGTDRGYMQIQVPDRERMILEYNNSIIKNESGVIIGVRGIARNITEQQNTRNALAKSEEKYRTILNSIEDAYYEVDLKGTITFFNNAMPRLLDYPNEELTGKNYRAFIDKKDVKAIVETFSYVYHTGTALKAFNWKLIKRDKTVCHVEISVSLNLGKDKQAVGFLGIVRDITARLEGEERRKELEAQLHHSHKLESIGTLAGGIAHDFNNILFPIIGYTEMTMEELPMDSPLRDNLDKVMKSVTRAKAMVQQILAFSRQSSDQFTEPVRIESIIRETTKFLKKTFPATIEIEEKIPTETGKVSINLSKLYQVIINLCTNALHAMEDQPAGKLEITIEQVCVTEKETKQYHNISPGEYLRIRVADNGKGIAPEDMGKIFEPYFTTKSQDKGTGLGLSVSYGIVKNAGGLISVKSVLSKGSHFDIFLPVVDEDETMSRESADFFSPLPTGSEHILLVDDEHRIVELERQIIENLGYRVFSRTSSIEALEAFRYDPHRFDLVITDQNMPNMTGVELASKMLIIRPDLPIIICTGFSEKVTSEKIKAIGIKAFLRKPIPKTDMAFTIRQVLDNREDAQEHLKHCQPIASNLL